MRLDAVKWLTGEFNQKYKGKFRASGEAATPSATRPVAASNPAAKRRRTSTSGFMADSSDEDSGHEGDNPEQEDTDELTAYLAVEQLKVKKTDPESIVGDWWLANNKAKFPNLEVMARQYRLASLRHRPALSASSRRSASLTNRLLRQARKRYNVHEGEPPVARGYEEI